MINNMTLSWSGLRPLLPKLLLTLKLLLIIVMLDLVVSISLSFVLSDVFYFNKYIYDKKNSSGVNYQKAVDIFYRGEYFIKPNEGAGWSRKLNLNIEEDPYPLKNPLDVQLSQTSIKKVINYEASDKSNLVYIYGSSVMTGAYLEYADRASAILRDYGYDVLDFSSANYTIGQSFSLFKAVLSKYPPGVIVVSIHEQTDALTSMFFPFREHNASFPLLKPAYKLVNGKLSVMAPPFDAQRRGDIAGMLKELRKHDVHYDKFQRYKRLGLLPISEFLWRLTVKRDNNFYNLDKHIETVELQKYFMKAFVRLAKKNDIKVVFIKYDDRPYLQKSFPKKLLHRFFKSKNRITNELLASSSINVIFTTQVINQAGMSVEEAYVDNSHLTAKANKALLQKVYEQIAK